MSKVSYAFTEAPAAGQCTQIVKGIDWIRMPLPFALDHVNCWYLHGEGESCLIDTGVHTTETLDSWNHIISDKGHPKKLLVTHFHPDHSGLAGWFAETGSDVISSEIEWGIVHALNAIEDARYQALYVDWYKQNDIDQPYIDAIYKMGNTYKARTVPPPTECEYLSDGDTVELGGRRFNVMTGQGHSPDMLMLYSEQDALLIAADQVLPAITPNISLMPHSPDTNPLDSFLSCLARLKQLPEETLVLPSHGLPFTGLHERIDFLLDHHQQRLAEIQVALKTEQSAAALFPVLFKRKLDHQQLSFALGETLAHLVYLEKQSLVECQARDGVDYYRAI